MEQGSFYFLKEEYFIDFPDPYLMGNKERVGEIIHNRPCFYSFKDEETGLYWVIPISSRVSKYKAIYDEKIRKYGKCNTILFGKVLGQERAFLIQNICPVSSEYIKNVYVDSFSNPVRVPLEFEIELKRNALHVLKLQRNGVPLIYPDVLTIEKQLMQKDKLLC